ncbi:Transposase, MuDR, plant [Corchorus capsularis]|uniref:Transposase, MuDR, plant n=1 Tax=Corchorus capsularis TaxID=210143 RepID=A0A1R3INL5_COCAP|nr:Transposase, MuDR, plant [Corchorus capsularis]
MDNNVPSTSNEVELEDFGGDSVDYSPLFVTDQTFETDSKAIDWAKHIAIRNGFELTISSQKDGGRKKILQVELEDIEKSIKSVPVSSKPPRIGWSRQLDRPLASVDKDDDYLLAKENIFLPLLVHYQGRFEWQGPRLRYVDGIVDDIRIDPDKLSYFEIVGVFEDNGYQNVKNIYYLRPGFRLEQGLTRCSRSPEIYLALPPPENNGNEENGEGNDEGPEGGVQEEPVDHIEENDEAADIEEPVVDQEVNEQAANIGEVVHNEEEVENHVEVETEEYVGEAAAETSNVGDKAGPSIDEDEGGYFDVRVGVDPAYYTQGGLGEDSDDDEFVDSRQRILRELKSLFNSMKRASTGDEGNGQDNQERPENTDGAFDEDWYYNEEVFGEVVNDDDEKFDDATRRAGKYPVYDGTAEKPYIEKGMLFTSTEEFKHAVSLMALHAKKAIVWVKNDRRWVTGKCKAVDCPWRIYGTFDKHLQSFQYRTFNSNHDCGKAIVNPRLSRKLLKELYEDEIRDDPFIQTEKIVKDVRKKYGVGVKMTMVRRAKKEVFDDVIQNYSKEFSLLWDYALAIRKSNPGSTTLLQVHQTDPEGNSNPVFDRFYVCFAALKKGFQDGCRPFIGLDGCWLKSLTKGELLVAVGRDANNQMYPFAWALVEKENTVTWKWFLELLIEDIDIVQEGSGWTLMTDQQKGLDKAIHRVLPRAEHRYCARHVYVNFYHRGFKGEEMRQCFWRIAHAITMREYLAGLEELKKKRPLAYKDLMEVEPPHHSWCRAWFKDDSMCELVDNNICEAFNGSLLGARRLSVVSLFEEIRRKLIERIASKIKECSNWKGNHGRRIWNVIEKNSRVANNCEVMFNGDDGYEIQHGEDRYVVRLDEKKCSCRRYTLSGIPCAHAICAIRERGAKIEDYVSSWYHASTYMACYANVLQPMTGRSDWPKAPGGQLPIQPPPFERVPGRPKTARRKKPDEPNKDKDDTHLSRVGQIQTCSKCQQQGHNKKSCKKDMEGTRAEMTSQPTPTPTVQQGRIDATGEFVEVATSGSFIFSGSQSMPHTIFTNFSISASATGSIFMPASVSTQVSAEKPTAPSQQQTSASTSVPKKSKPPKATSRPLPKILTMPPRTGDCSWIDEAGNHHGLKRGRSSPASVAKFKKAAVAQNRVQSSQAPVRRSPRNLQKGSVE